MIRQLCKQALFQDDGTLDLSRCVWLGVVACYLAQSLWSEFRGQPFDWRSFGLGAGAVLAGGGIGVKFHGDSR